jgi:hypothetical protein
MTRPPQKKRESDNIYATDARRSPGLSRRRRSRRESSHRLILAAAVMAQNQMCLRNNLDPIKPLWAPKRPRVHKVGRYGRRNDWNRAEWCPRFRLGVQNKPGQDAVTAAGD